MKKLILGMVLLASSQAFAQQADPGQGSFTIQTSPSAIATISSPQQGDVLLGIKATGETSSEIFRMEYGACLKGPLVFKNPIDQKEMFRLSSGADYPTGCSK